MRRPDAETAFRELFEAAYDDLLCFVERRIHLAVADDVVAEVFLVAWRRFDTVPEPLDEARAWLFTAAHNVLRNGRRSHQRQHSLALRIQQEPDDTGGTEADGVAARIDLGRAWQRLSLADQEVLTLTVFEGLTGTQAARLLNISRPAFSLRLLRARRRLHHLLRPQPENPPLRPQPENPPLRPQPENPPLRPQPENPPLRPQPERPPPRLQPESPPLRPQHGSPPADSPPVPRPRPEHARPHPTRPGQAPAAHPTTTGASA
ncbi:sigma-70 family RNA polymerase sigma factor [Actinoplanes sp. NPDC089786]|uniref:RNA polymerase sigma factor n=1 Tax=Actinoplanes sp. NPDC089786 TaxID=3155185 RepID=UPI00343D7C58